MLPEKPAISRPPLPLIFLTDLHSNQTTTIEGSELLNPPLSLLRFYRLFVFSPLVSSNGRDSVMNLRNAPSL